MRNEMRHSTFLSFVGKEWRHILRERRTLVMLFAIPVALVMLFGFVISTDIDHTPVAVLDASHGDPLARRLIRKLSAAGRFEVVRELADEAEIDDAFREGRVRLAVVIPAGFESDAGRRGSSGAVDCRCLGPQCGDHRVGIRGGDCRGAQYRHRHPTKKGGVRTNVRMMYNPELKSAYMFVPGVIAMIVMIVSAVMTSVTLAREKENGTLRLLTVSPLKARTIVLAKVVPYFVLTAINTAGIMLLGMLVFGLPCYGSLWGLALLCALFILAAVGLGLLISSLVRTTIGPLFVALGAAFADDAPLGLRLPDFQHAGRLAGGVSGGAGHVVYRRGQGADAQRG